MAQRRFILILFALILLPVIFGAPFVRLPVLTEAVGVVFPAAMGVPVGVPPLWLPGAEPLVMWGANLVAAVVFVLAGWRVLRKPPRVKARGARTGGRWWAWRRVVVALVVALVLANLIRATVWSFYSQPSLTIFSAYVLLTAVLSAIVGAAIGAVLGGVAAAGAPRTAGTPQTVGIPQTAKA